jgi:hypothetical protein
MGRLLDLADSDYRSSRDPGREPHRHRGMVAAIIVLALLLAITAAYTGWSIGARVSSGQGLLPRWGAQDGTDGSDGSGGSNGQDGSDGSNGLGGAAGPSGPPGPAGSPGATGAPGAAGSPGPPGAPGASLGLGEGVTAIGTCDRNVGIALNSTFDFAARTFWLSNFTLTRVSSACDGLRLDITLYDAGGRVLGATEQPVTLLSGGLPEFFVTVLSAQFDRRIDSMDVALATIEISP